MKTSPSLLLALLCLCQGCAMCSPDWSPGNDAGSPGRTVDAQVDAHLLDVAHLDTAPSERADGAWHVDAASGDQYVAPDRFEVDAAALDSGLPDRSAPDALTPCVPTTDWTLQQKWSRQSFAASPHSRHIWATPLVARLHDDNGDNVIDARDKPNVVVITFDGDDYVRNSANSDQFNDSIRGTLRVLSGVDGQELLALTDRSAAVASEVTPAIADIDGDAWPEIVAVQWELVEGEPLFPGAPKLQNKYATGHLIAFEHSGEIKWVSEAWTGSFDDIENTGAVSVADINQDGWPEIILGADVFDRNGDLLWRGLAGRGNSGHGANSLAMDLTSSPGLELLAGNTLYSASGAVLWTRDDLNDGPSVAGQVSGQSGPDVVLNNRSLWILEASTGGTRTGPVSIPTIDPDPGLASLPTLADLDGDGLAEIVISAPGKLNAFAGDGTLLWSVDIDEVNGIPTPSAFDFDHDGSLDVVFADEQNVQIRRGSDGTLLASSPRLSLTLGETVAIADIDGDGHSELVMGQNDPQDDQAFGIIVLGNTTWAGSPAIYNQQAYFVTNIDIWSAVPQRQVSPWTLGPEHNAVHFNLSVCSPP